MKEQRIDFKFLNPNDFRKLPCGLIQGFLLPIFQMLDLVPLKCSCSCEKELFILRLLEDYRSFLSTEGSWKTCEEEKQALL